ncbi:hypothetical protein PLESTB_001801300 [Pleodorina starrii]|uniref:Uncharacterized protein n=1 Tax=Pleodorina starrii TaxID=330485 RepID=A0A9W6BD08_9CHLO|nr:hypothetical protein PLESTM_001928200 [Pleodorina starrii]GLC49899.1 hypothetical protein PLESTB_000320800 [Pleodorina starrii]GLC61772.1 hypothetical protein PLESTB_001801300 [Pleodorina starrii]GLC67931.1 hypothetical protein PLESTF_000624200 [Pleodorina starrii]GLC68231.1 hypothetical protein PLESTF_000664600 [Pleodorina starrii]
MAGAVRGGHTALTCTVEQVLVYITLHWVPRHGRYGQPARAKSTLGQLSHLSTQLCHLGRGDTYDELSCTGNPCHSVDVQLYRRGLTRGAIGEEEVSAVPLTYAKYRRLIHYLRGQIRLAVAVTRLLLLRDLVCFLLMWETATRGHDCGKLQLTDFRDPRNPQRAYGGFPLPLPGGLGGYPDGFRLLLSQLGTKTYQGVRAPPVMLEPNAAPEMCLVRALAEYMQACGAPGAPPGSGLTGYLFRPLRADHTGFREAPLGSSGLTYRLRQHLQQAGLYGGETCHSFRRGTLQHMEANGAETAAMLARGQMRQTATLQRYLDPLRHLPVAAPGVTSDGSKG